MQGSLYPDGVTVDQVALRRTELTKAQEILRNRIDWTCRGVYSGGVITVNTSAPPPNLNIDIMQASGFAPNGEYVQTDSAYYNLSLADYTLGTVNYVCLVYSEAGSFRQPHESDGSRYYTRSEMAWRVRIYTAAQYAALPATDENLANDAQDRIILFGKVTANGPGISLTSSSIESPRTFNNIMYTVPRKCLVVLGVDILAASAGSPVGSGTLSYTYTPGSPPLYDFQWTTSNGAGALVNVTADGTYTLLDGAGEWIKILVSLAVLPTFVIATTITETITVYNLYYQEMPRLSAEDHLHRNYIGTGVISPTNPHGMSLDDISGESFSLLDEHQDVLHCNGIWRGSASTLFQISINNLPGNDTFSLIAPVGGDLYYVNGIKLSTIDITTVSITPPAVQSTYFYEICVSDEATVEYVQKAAYPAARTVTGTWIVDMSKDYPFGSATLTCSTAGALSPKVFTWDGGKSVTLTPLVDPPQAIRLYAADGEHWIDLWVNTNIGGPADEFLPAANVSDVITISASLTDGTNQFMQLAGVLYWYDAGSAKWVLGYHPLDALRHVVDKRIWGNTGTENMATWALEDLAYLPNNELGRSGALLRRNGVYNEFQYTYGGTGFTIDVNGGSFYCRGQRISVPDVQNLVVFPSAVQLVWADMSGAYQVINVTGTFTGDLQAAMRYVLGFTQNIPSVSATYHYSDAGDAPERGVLLYYLVTDATDITRVVDFTQNVNRVDDPWSVGSRLTTSTNAVHAQAAYDSLFTAFEYAKYSMYGTENKGAVTLTVIGTVEVGFKITQPEYVNVRGTRGVSVPSKSIVRVAGTDTWGTWQLSAGCKISNLSVYNTSATLPAITLNHYATAEECFFASLGGPVFRTAESTALSSSGVVLRNNTSAGAPFLKAAYLPNGHIGWIITGNEILSVPAGLTGAVELPNVEKLTISDNIISLPDSNDAVVTASGGINIISNTFQCQDVTIRDNYISVGNNAPAQLNSVAGIYLKEVWFATVSGNTIKRASGSATQIGVGIYVNGIAQSSIVDNKIGFLGGGIVMRGYLYDTEVSRNKMQALFHAGIDAYINYFPTLNSTWGLRFEENDVYIMVKGTVGGLFPGSDLVGVSVWVDLSVSDAGLTELSVSGNCVSGLSSNANVYGVVAGIERGMGAVCNNIKVEGNSISALSSATGAMTGLSFDSANVTQMLNASVSGNQVIFTSATTSPWVTGIYIDVFCRGLAIDGNIVMLDAAPHDADGVALYVGPTGSGKITYAHVSNNVLFGLKAGALVHVSVECSISGNNIYGKGCGLHVGGGGGDPVGTLVEGNRVRVFAYQDSPYGADADFPGAHCISTDADFHSIILKDNDLYLEKADRPVATDDVPEGSACIMLVRVRDMFIDGNKMACDAATVDNGDGSTDRAYLCYIQVGYDVASGRKTTCSISNNMFDDRQEEAGTTRTPISSLFIVPNANFDTANADQFVCDVKGNSFITSSYITTPFVTPEYPGGYTFNAEGLDGNVPTHYHPYVIYVSYNFGEFDGATRAWTHVYFVGNAIHCPADYIAVPYVFLPYYVMKFPAVVGEYGCCHYEEDSLANFANHNNGPLGSHWGSWLGI